MPPQQRIRRDDGVEFEQCLPPNGFGPAREQCPFRVGEPDSPSAQPLFEQPILGLQELDDEQLMPMDPARHDHQQKCE